MHHQFHVFLTAVMFYTRLPCPAWVDHSEELLNEATVYFPVIGWLVGGVAWAAYAASSWLFGNTDVALLLSLIATVLLTGAFHEDGFADVCDGFGGGWTRERILDIMKDSRLGTYGAAGLGLLLALKLGALRGLPSALVGPALLLAHPLSRATALSCIFSHDYARANETDGKAKPVAKKLGRAALATGLLLGALPLLAWAAWTGRPAVLGVVLVLAAIKWYLARYFQRWIGGYTGDCLGAIQQVGEVGVYLFLLAGRTWVFS